jgi:uncharacterized protein
MKTFLLIILNLYKRLISPFLGVLFGGACRFTPSCSQYTIEALEKFGVIKGLSLGLNRFLKCHPWGSFGYDPVPLK